MWSIGGTGTALRACTPHDRDGVFDATKWVTVLFLPVLPLHRARYRLVERRSAFPGRRQLLLQHLDALELAPAEVARTYALSWVAAPLAMVLPTAILGLPGVLLGKFEVAAAGAVLSSFWMAPFGIGLLLWLRGQPWPKDPQQTSWPALVAELRKTAGLIWGAVGGAYLLIAGGYGAVSIAIDLSGGLELAQALAGAAQIAAFFCVLCGVVGTAVWVGTAWKRAHP